MLLIGAFLVTIFPAGFLMILFGGGVLFGRRSIGQNGEAPIRPTLFFRQKVFSHPALGKLHEERVRRSGNGRGSPWKRKFFLRRGTVLR